MLIESEHLASLGQLIGGIAHNLKTPIMSVAGGLEGLSALIDEYGESIGDSEVTAEDHREIADEMRAWIGKMKNYTAYMSDIITTVKGQAVQLTASTTGSFSIKELIKRVEILMNHELKRYSCSLSVKCASIKTRSSKGSSTASFRSSTT
jgi:signal transduction histidine kinase